jgi:lysophospholipase L1-like esterase
MAVPAGADVAVSVYLPTKTGPVTWHFISRQTTNIGSGDHTAAATGADLPDTANSWYFLTGMDVLNDSGQGSIAVIGDSITDGVASPINGNQRWTDHLAARLVREAAGGRAPGVLNLGLAGNRLGLDGSDAGLAEFGVNASARFYSDVLPQAGVRTVIVELGINDVWLSHANANAIIADLQQLAGLAHQAGLPIYICTIMPWNGYKGNLGQYSPELDSVRLAVNSYIRTNTDFDGIIDMDGEMRDPASPTRLRADWDSGDHIHPNTAGYAAMANAVPLEMLLLDSEDANARPDRLATARLG